MHTPTPPPTHTIHTPTDTHTHTYTYTYTHAPMRLQVLMHNTYSTHTYTYKYMHTPTHLQVLMHNTYSTRTYTYRYMQTSVWPAPSVGGCSVTRPWRPSAYHRLSALGPLPSRAIPRRPPCLPEGHTRGVVRASCASRTKLNIN